MKLKLYLDIFITFFKIGPVTFGGGYAMIPLIEREVVTKRKWMTIDEISDIFAVSESVPGAIAINTATFVGYRIAGVWGAILAMVGILIPTFLIILLLSITYMSFINNPTMEAAFQGIRPAIVALIGFAGYKIGQIAIIDKTTLITAIITVILLLLLPIHPALFIIAGAFVGILSVIAKKKLGYRIHNQDQEQGGYNE